MKPVIIIAIVFALLIPITVFAQSSEKTISYSVWDATSSIFAGFVMLGIPILIILLIVLKKKGKLTGSLFKKILAIYGLFFLALLVTSIISSNFMSDVEKAERDERIAESEAEAEKQQRTEQRNEELRKQREKESSIEYKMENMVLNYKGIDGKGFTIEDFANAKCLKDQQGSFAQYMDDNFDDKSGYHSILIHTPVNLNLNPPCLGGGFWFGVNEQGSVIAWEYDSAEEILDYLDNQG